MKLGRKAGILNQANQRKIKKLYFYKMKSDEQLLESLIAGGVIGAALGALLSKDKEQGATVGALAGAAIVATFRANEEAKKTNVPVMIEENGKLFVWHPDGRKEFIKDIPRKPFLKGDKFKLR